MGRKIAYFCDPEKNTECVNRDICHANPENEGKKLVCMLTKNRLFAVIKENGKPKVYKPYLRRIEKEQKRAKKLGHPETVEDRLRALGKHSL